VSRLMLPLIAKQAGCNRHSLDLAQARQRHRDLRHGGMHGLKRQLYCPLQAVGSFCCLCIIGRMFIHPDGMDFFARLVHAQMLCNRRHDPLPNDDRH
jgi:hypothetical protein